MTTKFSHNGTEIELRENGKFYAQTATGLIEAPSLAALKKKLDAKGVFKPFKAIITDGYSDRKIKSVLVVGIKVQRRGSPEWRYTCPPNTYENTTGLVLDDTPANRKALQGWIDADKLQRSTAEKERNRINAMHGALGYRHPKDSQ